MHIETILDRRIRNDYWRIGLTSDDVLEISSVLRLDQFLRQSTGRLLLTDIIRRRNNKTNGIGVRDRVFELIEIVLGFVVAVHAENVGEVRDGHLVVGAARGEKRMETLRTNDGEISME